MILRLISVACVLAFCKCAIGQSDIVLESLLSAREHVVDFHFIARGKLTPQYDDTKSTYELWKQGKNIRCDWTLKPGGTKTTIIIGPESSYVRIGSSEVLKVSESMARKYIGSFDIRAAGLALYQEFGQGYSISEIVRSLQRQKNIVRSKQIEQGLIELEYGPLPEGEVRVFRIDPSKDFAILECIEKIPGHEPNLLQKASIEWASYFGEWVPTRIELSRLGATDRSFSIDWVSINEPIDLDIFDPKKAFDGSRFFVTEANGKMIGEAIHSTEPSSRRSGYTFLAVAGIATVIGCLLMRKSRRI